MIKGKVAQILSESEVVLNVGAKHGVKEGMEFVIYAAGPPIIDPDSGTDLGAIETVKGRVIVAHVMEAACRAKTKTYTETERSVFAGGGGFFGPQTVHKRTTLQVKKEQVHPISADLTVVIGDLVRSV
jgi:hypothetical protein